MQVRDIMSDRLVCCNPDTSLQNVARMMMEADCGAIPVVDPGNSRPLGMVTDRDITCRIVAKGQNPAQMKASDCMSTPVMSVTPDMSLEECCRIMEENQIRRVPVVDRDGHCCGMVAQADIARNAPEQATAEVVRDVSQDTGRSSQSSMYH